MNMIGNVKGFNSQQSFKGIETPKTKQTMEERIKDELERVPGCLGSDTEKKMNAEMRVRFNDIRKAGKTKRKIFKAAGAALGAAATVAAGAAGSIVGGAVGLVNGVVAGFNTGYVAGSGEYHLDMNTHATTKLIRGIMVGLGMAVAGGVAGLLINGPIGGPIIGAASGNALGKVAYNRYEKHQIGNARKEVEAKYAPLLEAENKVK